MFEKYVRSCAIQFEMTNKSMHGFNILEASALPLLATCTYYPNQGASILVSLGLQDNCCHCDSSFVGPLSNVTKIGGLSLSRLEKVVSIVLDDSSWRRIGTATRRFSVYL